MLDILSTELINDISYSQSSQLYHPTLLQQQMKFKDWLLDSYLNIFHEEEPEEDTRRDFEMLTHSDLCDEFAELLDLYAEDGENFIQMENIEDASTYLSV